MSSSNGAWFEKKHSYQDWKLIPKERAVISPAEPKYQIQEIPGSDEVIDDTEALDGRVHYSQRTYTHEFLVLDARKRWFSIYSEIQNYLQGKRLQLILDEDPLYYYEGRFKVNEWKSDKGYATIVIEGTLNPYKKERFNSLEDWEWDSFNFENGVIREYGNLIVEGTLELIIPGTRLSVVPVITVSDLAEGSKEMEVTFEGNTYTLAEGENEIADIEIVEGENVLIFSGTGTISIDYRGGSL